MERKLTPQDPRRRGPTAATGGARGRGVGSTFPRRGAGVSDGCGRSFGSHFSFYRSMRDTVKAFRDGEKELGRLRIIIGGVGVDDQVARFFGADYWATDAMEGVRICEGLTNRGDEGSLIDAG